MEFLSLFQTNAAPRRQSMKLKETQRAYFRVVDEQLKQKLMRWYERRCAANETICDYLKNEVVGVLGAEVPRYKVDEDGYIESINFAYSMPFSHDGWWGKENTHWLVPHSDEVKQRVRELPPLPSVSEVNELIGWPEAMINESFQDMHLPGYEEFARFANNQTRVFAAYGEVFVSVPFPDTFQDYPALADRVQKWRPSEDIMEQINAMEGRKLERLHAKSRSPWGRFREKVGFPILRPV